MQSVKRRSSNHEKFLRLQTSGAKLWNERRRIDSTYLSTPSTEFVPHLESGIVPEEVLNKFVEDRANTFLAASKLLSDFQSADRTTAAEEVVQRLNVFRGRGTFGFEKDVKPKTHATFFECPLVWDTGASFGLTPFRADFIDYVECQIPVNDIARTNMVIGIGTTLNKFWIDGEAVYLPCLSYHLPSAEIRLFSPQTYHTLYGGHSAVFGDKVVKLIDNLKIEIAINGDAGNVPMIYKSACTAEEIKNIGPHIRSALPHYERKIDFFGSWSSNNFANWGLDLQSDKFDTCGVFGLQVRNVGLDANTNLSNAQKELLLWHFKLGVSMRHIQQLMKVAEIKEPNGRVSVMDRVIVPKINAASNCNIPMCQTCQMSSAKQRKPNVSKSKVVESSVGSISKEQYQTGDFVSMDQYVVKTPGRLPSGYGREADHNMFHGGTIFRDAASKYIFVKNQVSLGAGETVTAKREFEEWLWEEARVSVKHYHSDNGVFKAEMFTDSCKEDGQTQSFSGVGAQHQNAEAERSIQTVVYMARHFMIHAALN